MKKKITTLAKMGCLQLRKCISVLPAAFFVYILLHYFIYQPMLHQTQTASFVTDKVYRNRKEENFSITLANSNSSWSMSVKYMAEPQGLLTLPKGGLLSPEGRNEPEDKSSKDKPITESGSEVKEQKSSGDSKRSVVTPLQPSKEKNPSGQNSSSETRKLQGQTNEPKKDASKVPKVPPPLPKIPLSFSINYLKGKIMVEDKYEKGFSTPQEEICPNNGRDLKVLILITTAPDHEKHRNAIRMTWGHFALRKDISLGFMVGRTSRGDIQTVIDKENERYGDIIEANFVDHYSNLTLKTVAMLEWAKTYCSESPFVLKTDDDMFINVPLLLAFIHVKKNEKNAMYGRLAKGWKPVRNKKSKYFVDTSTYSRIRYPDFLTGPAYLLTNDVIEKTYNKLLNTVFFFLEDVLVTGFVSESLKINRVGDSHFRNEKLKLSDTCKLMHSISIHMVKYEEQFDIYRRTLDGKTKCRR